MEKLWIWLAWRLPRGLVYWCTVRLGAAASADDRSVGLLMAEVPLLDALDWWNTPAPDQQELAEAEAALRAAP
jgi:hypothetical protein